ncbi:MAG: molybdopterin-guanine dinucleotide biosynthesis protein B [Gemmatimonadales bacterium]|jgi:molybdopterin-guanine dinucleotide biosynthesis protein MobB
MIVESTVRSGGGPITKDAAGPPVVAFCGWSGSGKTTLIEALIPRLSGRGLAVAVVKHDAHGVQLDTPGKDSDRFFRAGADVALRGPDEVVWRARPSEATTLERLLRALVRCHDVVLVEGHKDTALPKVWLASSGDDGAPPPVDDVGEVLPWGGERLARAEEIVLARLAGALQARPVIGGILIGGASRRMGRPKQLLGVAGAAMAERVAAALAPHVDETVLLGGGAAPASMADVPRLADPPGIVGPLAGILAAARWAPQATWIIAACDLPLIDRAAVGWLHDQRRPGRWAVLPMLPAGVEPLLAVYEPQAAELFEDLATAGESAPRRLADRARVWTPAPPEELYRCWYNANTPHDLAALETR